MIPIQKALSSTVGKKFVMGLSGLGLVGFIITHLAGNLSLYAKDGTAFNAYTEGLHSWGPLLLAAEFGLLALFLVHIVWAIAIARRNSDARPVSYRGAKPKGGVTHSNVSSRNMIFTGLVLLAFLVIHIWTFRFGPSVAEGYVTTLKGAPARDLHRLVLEVFSNPAWVAFYVFVMVLFGLHLRHGFWSAFQSLGAINSRFTKPINTLGIVMAILLAGGFLFIPIWIYFDLSSALTR